MFRHLGEARSRATAPPNRKKPAEVVRVYGQDASWTPSFRGVPGTSDWEERLHISSGLEEPQDPPGGADEHWWVEGCLGFIA